jgi:U4/U6.U5 tri-snRNP-associated protein 1
MDIDVKEEADLANPTLEEDGLEFDDTSEFVRAIQYNPVVVKEEAKMPRLPSARAESQAAPDNTRIDSPMEMDHAVEELEAGEVAIKEEEEEDEAMLNAIEAAITATEAEEMANGGESVVCAVLYCYL